MSTIAEGRSRRRSRCRSREEHEDHHTDADRTPVTNTGLRPMRSASMPQQRQGDDRDRVGHGDHREHRRRGPRRPPWWRRSARRRRRSCSPWRSSRTRRRARRCASGRGTARRAAPAVSSVLLQLVEDRGLLQLAAQHVGDRDDDQAEPERDPPAPAQQLVLGQRADREEHHARDDDADMVPLSVKLVKNARRWSGACSRSASSRRPARRRRRGPAAGAAATSRIGAAMPMWS